MRFSIIIFLFALYSCEGTSTSPKHKINQQAKKLNDSAVYLAINSKDYSTAISLLDKATNIDSNYFIAYNNKFSFLGLQKPSNTDKILETLIRLNKIRPEFPDFYLYISIIYIKRNDTGASQKYLVDAISHYDKYLDTMHKTNAAYELLLINKAFSLILLGKEAKGHDILKQAYDSQIDTFYKEMMAPFLHKSRKEIVDSLSIE